MDPKTCKSLINNIKIQRHEPIILYRTFKYVIEQILFYQIQHDNCHQWIECLENFPFDCILWNEDKFYTLLVLLISITEKWCQDCLMVWKSVFSNETIQDVIKKYLPRLLEQNRQLDVFEWKCLRNYSHYIIFPRSIQRSILTLIRDTIESYREVFEESSSIKIDAQVIFIIESAVHILFNISKVFFLILSIISEYRFQNDAGSITSICQQNVRSLIQFTMTLNGNSGQYKNNEETFDEQSSLRKLRQVEKNSALRIWKKSFSCNLTSFAVNCLMNQVSEILSSLIDVLR